MYVPRKLPTLSEIQRIVGQVGQAVVKKLQVDMRQGFEDLKMEIKMAAKEGQDLRQKLDSCNAEVGRLEHVLSEQTTPPTTTDAPLATDISSLTTPVPTADLPRGEL